MRCVIESYTAPPAPPWLSQLWFRLLYPFPSHAHQQMEHVVIGLQYQHEGLPRNHIFFFFLTLIPKLSFFPFFLLQSNHWWHFLPLQTLTWSCAFGLSRSSIFLPSDCGQKTHLGIVVSFVQHDASPDAIAQWHPDAVAHAGFGWLWLLPVAVW